jgi:hypothetical protein
MVPDMSDVAKLQLHLAERQIVESEWGCPFPINGLTMAGEGDKLATKLEE